MQSICVKHHSPYYKINGNANCYFRVKKATHCCFDIYYSVRYIIMIDGFEGVEGHDLFIAQGPEVKLLFVK